MRALTHVCVLWAVGIGLALAAVPASADLHVTYVVSQSELVLFGQPQESPFDRVSLALWVKGSRIRTETTDHFGHTRRLVADRATKEAYELDYATRTYAPALGSWSCDNIAGQVAAAAAELLSMSGADEPRISAVSKTAVGARKAQTLTVNFEGKVLGSPAPVAAELQLYFPVDEAAVYGTSQSLELYCGKKPTGAQWQAAFESHLSLGSDQAGELAKVASLPLQARLAASLSLGKASLTVSLDQVNHDELDDALFQPPPDFALRKE